jgi:hypothetical protein
VILSKPAQGKLFWRKEVGRAASRPYGRT